MEMVIKLTIYVIWSKLLNPLEPQFPSPVKWENHDHPTRFKD